ncbi:MAG: gamma-glutamyl-gamma-aminobutyrate hydrolase family protein [Synergistaceae bacterium]|nr:gamma-glutamyl-gamma-aminobutyrate hydrolase family protein [Synergistaceae bacterium]
MKKFLFTLMLVAFMLCMTLASCAAVNSPVHKDAILFSIGYGTDGADVLRFNSVRTADISTADIYDNTGSGITSLASLKTALGSQDIAPRMRQTLAEPFSTAIANRVLSSKAITADLEIGQNDKVRRLTVTGIRERPILGVSWENNNGIGSYSHVADGWERLGGYAVFLPQVTNAEEARSVLKQLNGFGATGGGDFHIYFIGSDTTPHGTTSWGIPRDWADIIMTQQAISLDVPFMGFCRGEQGFNVAMGGGLIQDIPYYHLQEVKAGRTAAGRISGQLAATTTHRIYKYEESFTRDSEGNVTLLPSSGTGAAPYTTVSCDENCSPRVYIDGIIHSGGNGYHPLKPGPNGEPGAGWDYSGILPNSKWLYNIVGSKTMDWARTAHHQAVDPKNLGHGLSVVAVTSDGIVEAIEHQSSLFAIGVQWHPEYNVLGHNGQSANINLDLDQSTVFLREHVKYAGIHKDRKALFSLFKDGVLPDEFAFENYDFLADNSNLEYVKQIVDKATLLSAAMLDGWSIAGLKQPSGTNWAAEVIGGSVVVTLEDDVDNGVVIVTLTKGGETKEVEIAFSGVITPEPEDDKCTNGCNAAHGYIAFAFLMGAAPYLISRRK